MASDRRSRRRKQAVEKPEGPGLEHDILRRYGKMGIDLLSDDIPERLDPTLRSEMESITGADLSEVRVHTGERAQEMAEGLGARAFAAGAQDVFFGQGEFSPQTPKGKALLAHELTHVAEGHAGMSRPLRKPEREELELRARRSESLVLAREKAGKQATQNPKDMAEPQAVKLPAESGAQAQAAQTSTVDKLALEEKVYEVIEREMKRERERIGR